VLKSINRKLWRKKMSESIDPVLEVMQVRASLEFLVRSMDDMSDQGEKNLLSQLTKQLDAAAQKLDDEKWGPRT
jgi:ATP-dependent DNA ligase